MRKVWLLMFCVLSLCGCVTANFERKLGESSTPKERSDLNLATGTETARLILEARPPSEQLMVNRYEFYIDDHGPYEVSKHSDTDITLDAGKHVLRVGAVGFGKQSRYEFSLTQSEWLRLEYVGPYWMWSSGKVSRK